MRIRLIKVGRRVLRFGFSKDKMYLLCLSYLLALSGASLSSSIHAIVMRDAQISHLVSK